MTMLRCSSWSQTEERKRRSRGSGEVQTRQVQVSKGTPWDVPVPKKVKSIRFDSGGGVRWRTSFAGFSRKEDKILPTFPASSAMVLESC